MVAVNLRLRHAFSFFFLLSAFRQEVTKKENAPCSRSVKSRLDAEKEGKRQPIFTETGRHRRVLRCGAAGRAMLATCPQGMELLPSRNGPLLVVPRTSSHSAVF